VFNKPVYCRVVVFVDRAGRSKCKCRRYWALLSVWVCVCVCVCLCVCVCVDGWFNLWGGAAPPSSPRLRISLTGASWGCLNQPPTHTHTHTHTRTHTHTLHTYTHTSAHMVTPTHTCQDASNNCSNYYGRVQPRQIVAETFIYPSVATMFNWKGHSLRISRPWWNGKSLLIGRHLWHAHQQGEKTSSNLLHTVSRCTFVYRIHFWSFRPET